MRMYDIIEKKKHKEELTTEEIRFFIDGYTKGEIPDYQASAFCMAVWFNGMTDREIADLTMAMAESGDQVDLSAFGTKTADKHSTGGVGDKTSLIVMPVVASLGCTVAKMTGRGLGHTGGTADKLESIPGFRISLSADEFMKQVENTGIAVAGQSANMTPADKKLYALRDVTATVDCIPLIASSIMSKKLASGARNIVLDVKCGSGAFMKTPEDARLLAEKMVMIGKAHGRNMAAVITDMDVPLGTNIGNALEVKEAVAVLRDGLKNDLYEVCVTLASELTALTLGLSLEEAKKRVEEALSSGAAYKKLKEWISAQGGDIRVLDDLNLLPKAAFEREIRALKSGYMTSMDTEKVGMASCILGAGRLKKEDDIDYSAGIILNKKTGDTVEKGECLAVLYTNDEKTLDPAEDTFRKAVNIGESFDEEHHLVYGIVR